MATSGSFLTSGYVGSKDTIYLKFSWERTSYSIANNTSTISWTLAGSRETDGYVKAGGFKVTLDGETVYSISTNERLKLYNGTIVASGTKTFTHNDDGTKSFTAYAEGGIFTYEVNCTGSKTFTLDTIARASTISVSNGTLGTSQTIGISKKISDSYHRIKYTCGSESANITVDGSDRITGTSVDFTPPLSLASQNVSGTSVSIVYTLYTYMADGTEVGTSTKTVTCAIPDSVKPTVEITVSDPTGYADIYGGYIQGHSKILVESDTTLAYGSSIQKKVITAEGKSYVYTQPLPTSVTIESISGSGTITVSITVTDGRGRSVTASTTITVLPYVAPVITLLNVHRCDEDGTENNVGSYAKATYSYTITSLSELNEKSATLKYKKSAENSYTSVSLTAVYAAENLEYIFAADDGSSYDIELVIEDAFGSASRKTSISTANVIMHYRADGTGIAFGKVSELSNAVELGWDLHNNGTIFDKYGKTVTNGMAMYQGAAEGVIDPNTTTEELILTNHENAPMGAGVFYYIKTVFYGGKSTTAYRAQYGMPYNDDGSMYHRRYDADGWSPWRRHVNDDESPLALAPIPNNQFLKSYKADGTEANLIGMAASNNLWIGQADNMPDKTVLSGTNVPVHYKDGTNYSLLVHAENFRTGMVSVSTSATGMRSATVSTGLSYVNNYWVMALTSRPDIRTASAILSGTSLTIHLYNGYADSSTCAVRWYAIGTP